MILPVLAGIGSVATGASSLISAIGGGGQQQAPAQAMPGFDLTPLYASLLMGDNANLSAAGQEMGAFLGDLMRGRGLQDQIGYNQTMGQFNETMNQQRMATGLQSGVASMLQSNAIGLSTEEARSKLATQMAGVENMYAMRQDQRDAKAAMDQSALSNAGAIMKGGVDARGQLALAGVNNDMALKQTSMNNATSLAAKGLEGRQASLLAGIQNQGNLLNTGLEQTGETQRTGIKESSALKQLGLTEKGQTQRTGIKESSALKQLGLTQKGETQRLGIGRAADLSGKSMDAQQALMLQGNELRAQQQQTGMKEAGATDRAGIQSMTQQNIAAMGTDKDLLIKGMGGTQQIELAGAQGQIQAGLAAQATANKLAGQQGESNVRIGEAQEGLRNELISMVSGTKGNIYGSTVGNIQKVQGQQEMLKGSGQLQRDMLVGQTDQQRQLQEDKFEGEQSLIGGKAIADQEMLIGKTKADQAMLYGQIQADKVRGEMEQGRSVEMAREKFNQDFAMQDARFKQDMAKKRYGAGMAMAGQRAFA